MLTIEEYITKRKHEDNVDEFDQNKKFDNTKVFINYVIDYFGDYLNVSNAEMLCSEHVDRLGKYKKQLKDFDDSIAEWLLDLYDKHEIKVNMSLNHYLKSMDYFLLYYKDDEFMRTAEDFCRTNAKKIPYIISNEDKVYKLIKETFQIDSKQNSDFKEIAVLKIPIFNWLKETYKQYSVNIYDFVNRYITKFSDNNPDEYDYDYKHNSNLFNIDLVYRENIDRPFINGHKDDLEFLFMYNWLNSIVGDDEYWKEYYQNKL